MRKSSPVMESERQKQLRTMNASNEESDKVKLSSRSVAMSMQYREVVGGLHLRAREGRSNTTGSTACSIAA